MTQLVELAGNIWGGDAWALPEAERVLALEQGKVLYLPQLMFALTAAESALLDPAIADPDRKNISLDPRAGRVLGVIGPAERQQVVAAWLARYAAQAGQLVDALFPAYRGWLRAAPTSLRLHQVERRQTSWRKDDSRLHVDAFPSRPNHGERILRVFANINPDGQPRVWRVGEPFEAVAARLLPRVPLQWPGSAWLLRALRITARRRSAYDHIMLKLHDGMKSDLPYQRDSAQQTCHFAAGSTWICFSDQVSHAAMAGQFMLEQTYFLPVEQQVHRHESPLAVLERLTGRALI